MDDRLPPGGSARTGQELGVREVTIERRGKAALAGWVALAATVATALPLLGTYAWWLALVLAPLAFASLGVGALLGRRWASRTTVAVRGGLELRNWVGHQQIAFDRIATAIVLPHEVAGVADGGCDVEIGLRNGDALRIACQSRREGEALLALLGHHAGKRVVAVSPGRNTAVSLWMTLIAWTIGYGALPYVLVSPPAVRALSIVATLVMSYGLARVVVPPAVVVGADGVIVRGRFRRRYVPYAAVARAERSPGGRLALVLDDGRTLLVGTGGEGREYVDALCARIEQRRAAALDAHLDDAALAQLDRRGRGLRAWQRAIAAAIRGAGGYRGVHLERRDLLCALADSAARPERRIGAAIGLRLLDGDDAARSIRDVARAVARPRLRIALESIAAGAAEEALVDEALENEAGRRRQVIGAIAGG